MRKSSGHIYRPIRSPRWRRVALGRQVKREANSVTRYVVTYVNRYGARTLAQGCQGRYTYATEAEAQAWLDAMQANNGADTVRSVFGENPRFEVRPCQCYPGHFDPMGVYFD